MSAPHQVLASPASRLCVPLDEWPEHDRRRWLEAQQPAVRRRSIHDPVPADRGRPRRRIETTVVGQVAQPQAVGALEIAKPLRRQ